MSSFARDFYNQAALDPHANLLPPDSDFFETQANTAA